MSDAYTGVRSAAPWVPADSGDFQTIIQTTAAVEAAEREEAQLARIDVAQLSSAEPSDVIGNPATRAGGSVCHATTVE